MMEPLRLTEGDEAVPWSMSDETARALSQSEVAVVSPTYAAGEWRVSAGKKVGVAKVGDLQVTVVPKLPIDRLIFLMGYTRDPQFWRNSLVKVDTDRDLPEALSEAFGRLATKALEQGLIHGYQETEETQSVLRGRIRVGDQIRRNFGRAIPLELRFDEFTVDVPENQLMLAATMRLLRLPLGGASRRTLRRLRLQLAEVSDLPRGEPSPEWIPSRLNIRYQPALRVAELILAGNSFEQRVGEVAVSGFMFDMWKIYEEFVCVALRESLTPLGGRSHLQYRTHLDTRRVVPMRPDFVWTFDGRPGLVVDAKYKAERDEKFPHADLYQLLSYCTVLGLADGHLIYAKGPDEPAVHDVAGSGVRIHCHALDLAKSPAQLLAQIDDLTQRIGPGGLAARALLAVKSG